MKSREKLMASARSLFEKNNFYMVTVETILREAGVSRATFYRHFIDKYDLLLNTIFIENPSLSEKYNVKWNWEEHRRYCHRLAREIMRQKPYIRKVSKADGPNSLWSVSLRWLSELYHSRVLFNSTKTVVSPEEELIISIYCSGIVYAAYQWIHEEIILSADAFADSLCDAMPKSLKQYFCE